MDFSPASWLQENTLTAIKSANLHSKMAIGGVLDASQSYIRQPAHMQKSSSSHRIVFRGFGTYYLIMLACHLLCPEVGVTAVQADRLLSGPVAKLFSNRSART